MKERMLVVRYECSYETKCIDSVRVYWNFSMPLKTEQKTGNETTGNSLDLVEVPEDTAAPKKIVQEPKQHNSKKYLTERPSSGSSCTQV